MNHQVESGATDTSVSKARWLITIVLTVIAALWAAWDAAVAATATRNPAVALRLTSTNGVVIGKAFDKDFLSKNADVDGAAWRKKAVGSLRAEPLNAAVIRIIATVGEARGDDIQRTAQIMRLAERVSRRDGMTQLWLIEYAVSRQDVAGALAHYNRALSTRPALGNSMIPILAQAIEQPEVRLGLVPYLRAGRPWSTTFLLYAIDHSKSVSALVELFEAYGGARSQPNQRPIERALLARLVRDNRYDLAASYVGRMVDISRLSNFGINEASRDPHAGPFAWVLYSGAEGDAHFEGNAVVASIQPNATVTVLSRLVRLAPGPWILSQHVADSDGLTLPDLRWTASCARETGLDPIWQEDRSSSERAGTAHRTFTVPVNCPIVRFDLSASGADTGSASAVNLSNLDLRRP